MRILQIDTNHILIKEQLEAKGFQVEEDFNSSYQDLLHKIPEYDGLILRSRVPIDKHFIDHGLKLKFIARVGAGMENIDTDYAEKKGIALISSPEGNRDSVAEHVVGMLLLLLHRLSISSLEVKEGIWKREENRGNELKGKVFGIIGYGHMGKATAQRLSGFDLDVIYYDILPGLQDKYAREVSLLELMKTSDIISLHLPQTSATSNYIDQDFIEKMEKPFYLVNTARGKNVKTKDLVQGLQSGKILGAALDVLEYEKTSFEGMAYENKDLQFLLSSQNVIVTPHIAGWSIQSKIKLAQVIVDKILARFPH